MKQALLPGIPPDLLTQASDETGPADAIAEASGDVPDPGLRPELREDQHLLPGFTLPGYTLVGLLDMDDGRPIPVPPEARGQECDAASLRPGMRIFEPERPSSAAPPLTVVGLGLADAPVGAEAIRAVRNADVLALPQRLMSRYRRHRASLIPLAVPLESCLAALEEHRRQGQRCVVLADGDPLLFGIGSTLARRAGSSPKSRRALRILPGVSAMQTACARLALPWNDIATVSVHGREDWLPLAHASLTGRPVCVYTDAVRTPAHVARFLLERGVDWYRMAVAAHLESSRSGSRESVRELALHEAARQDFAGGETVVLLPDGPVRGPRLGLDESSLVLDGGLYTKAPVRAAALSLLGLFPEAVVWDIGAGSGCLSLEAAALAHRGRVCAVERNPDRVLCIQENRRRLGVPHLDIFRAAAPASLEDLPDPNAIFLGGGLAGHPAADNAPDGGQAQAEELLSSLFRRLRPGGVLVTACVLISSLERVTTHFRTRGTPCSVTQALASVSSPLAGSLTLKALNPVFLIRAAKNG